MSVLLVAASILATFSLPAYASEQTIDNQLIDYDLLIARTSNRAEALTSQQKVLADRLYQRVYHLYSQAYYQNILDELIGKIQPDGDKMMSLSAQQKLSCFNSLSTLDNYQKMVRYFTDSYVSEHSIDEVKQTLILLNYFFIDELARAVVQADNSNLEASFHQQLKSQGLESTYQAFINPYPFLNGNTNESSLDYFDIKSLAGLDIFRTNEQLAQAAESESYIASNPYPNLMWTFIMSNIEACGKT
ncbi:MAG: hypothetical protein Q4P13_06725 [Psychrobacter sp.]|nr:hypothetical protein [Psychrobacter sp.]